MILFFVTLPKVAKASNYVAVTVAVACHCRWQYHAKLCQWKHGLKVVVLTLATLGDVTQNRYYV